MKHIYHIQGMTYNSYRNYVEETLKKVKVAVSASVDKESAGATIKAKETLQVKGDFTLAGTTRHVVISIDLVPEGEGIRITSSWALLITEYNIKRPSKAFFKVEDKDELGINALLVKE